MAVIDWKLKSMGVDIKTQILIYLSTLLVVIFCMSLMFLTLKKKEKKKKSP